MAFAPIEKEFIRKYKWGVEGYFREKKKDFLSLDVGMFNDSFESSKGTMERIPGVFAYYAYVRFRRLSLVREILVEVGQLNASQSQLPDVNYIVPDNAKDEHVLRDVVRELASSSFLVSRWTNEDVQELVHEMIGESAYLLDHNVFVQKMEQYAGIINSPYSQNTSEPYQAYESFCKLEAVYNALSSEGFFPKTDWKVPVIEKRYGGDNFITRTSLEEEISKTFQKLSNQFLDKQIKGYPHTNVKGSTASRGLFSNIDNGTLMEPHVFHSHVRRLAAAFILDGSNQSQNDRAA